MPSEERVTFFNRRGQRLCGIVHRPDAPPKAGAILCHGMGSSKESEKFIMLGREMSARGMLALRFFLLGRIGGKVRGGHVQRRSGGHRRRVRCGYGKRR